MQPRPAGTAGSRSRLELETAVSAVRCVLAPVASGRDGRLQAQGKSGPVYRVRVGPEVSRDSAERLRQQLATAAGLKGLVQAYP